VTTTTIAAHPQDTDYRPSEHEDYMNERQLNYFRKKLMSWRDEILQGAKETVNVMQKETENLADIIDRASSESDRALELRTRDRQRKLISKIEEAMAALTAIVKKPVSPLA
jgi:DnaK suppressor protein